MDMPILLSLASMALTAVLAYFGAQKGTVAKLAKLEAMVDTLSSRVEKHNSVVERTAALEAQIRDIDARLDRLESR